MLFAVFCLASLCFAAAQPSYLILQANHTVRIDPWGRDSLRVRIAVNESQIRDDLPGALSPSPPSFDSTRFRLSAPNQIKNGNIQATVAEDTGLITFTRVNDNEIILKESSRDFPNGNGNNNTVTIVILAAKEASTSCSSTHCCLDLTNWNTDEHANVAISDCHPTENGQNQLWTRPDSENSQHIRVTLGGKCLTVANESSIETDSCASEGNAQKWIYNTDGTIQNSGGQNPRCLAVAVGPNGPFQDGNQLTMMPCNASDIRQLWTYVDVPVNSPSLTSEGFASTSEEMIFGFGEHQKTGLLNYKGQTFNMKDCIEYGKSHGGEICLPFILGATKGSIQYGLLWNMPNFGSVSFQDDAVTWSAQSAIQIDYFVTTRTATGNASTAASDVLNNYVDAVGHAPMLPWYASGYWHSKNRYASQADLLAVAREFRARNIPIQILVIDYNHWVHMGDWSFDPKAWPDVEGMMRELYDLDLRVMVSVWPFTANGSSSFDTMQSKNYVADDSTTGKGISWPDGNCRGFCYLYDPTQDAARQYVWSRLKTGYYDYGIKIFWLDAAEPENINGTPENSRYSVGPFEQTGMIFPYYHSKTIHEGMMSEGEIDSLILTRSAWAGMQRWGAAVWSGDTHSDFGALQRSIAAGLNIQLSGIAWWTTDIGGYGGGNPSDPEFRELVVRWFQYGAFCPLFRQHGARSTEMWLYGNDSYNAILEIMQLRESMRPYVMEQMALVNRTGTPVNRPLWFNYPDDPNTWGISTEFMFGTDYLVAPVFTYQAKNWTVYLPSGDSWKHYYTGTTYKGGTNVTVDTPLNQFPLFQRVSS